MKKGEAPLAGHLLVNRQFDWVTWFGRIAIKDADGIGFELDGEPFNFVLDGLLAVRNLDDGAVFASVKLTLNKNMSAFEQLTGYVFGEAMRADSDLSRRLEFGHADFVVDLERVETAVRAAIKKAEART